jgi:hypothetical protein
VRLLRYAEPTGSRPSVQPSAASCGTGGRQATKSLKIVQWRATVDEHGHYSFAVAL